MAPDLETKARKYKRLAKQLEKIQKEKDSIRDDILAELEKERVKTFTTTNGVKITAVAASLKGLSLIKFKQLAAEVGLDRIYAITNVVQNRMTPAEKSDLEVIGTRGTSIRVTLPPDEY